MTGRATAIDVAREAGVSQTTVSFVINDSPNRSISDSTRQRVLDAAERLGYRPSAAARALVTGRSDIVLFLLPDIELTTITAQVLDVFTSALESVGLHLVTRRPQPGQPLAAVWQGLSPVAVIGWGPVAPEDAAELRDSGVVLLATVDDKRLARLGELQVEHLAERGHTTIAFAEPRDGGATGYARTRYAGVVRRCKELGLTPPALISIGLDAEDAATEIRALVDRHPAATAICACNDDHAFAVLAGIRRLGLRTPEDIAVIGVDNIRLAPLTDPPLTTIDPHIERYAQDLAHGLLAAIASGATVVDRARITPEIVVRQTT